MISSEDGRILDEVGRWKVIWLRDLFRLLGVSTGYTVFCRKIRRLERDGWLNGGYFRRSGKCLWLTEKGADLSATGAMTEEKTLHHDLVRTETLLKLLAGSDNFTSGSVSEGMATIPRPDGVLHFLDTEKNPLVFAVEIELGRGGGSKMMDKLLQYAGDSHYSHVLHILKKKHDFKSYINKFSNIRGDRECRIVFSLAEKLGSKDYDVNKAIYWHKGEYRSFKQLFGG